MLLPLIHTLTITLMIFIYLKHIRERPCNSDPLHEQILVCIFFDGESVEYYNSLGKCLVYNETEFIYFNTKYIID